MEKKPRKIIEDNEGVGFVTGLGERLIEDADKALKNEIDDATVPLRLMIDACGERPQINLKDSDWEPREDGSIDPEVFFTLIARKLFDVYRDWNRKRRLNEFMHEQEEFRQWMALRKAELKEQENVEKQAAENTPTRGGGAR